ncbi:MAG: FAD:protein FMN transferase [Planctomycetaceae bacterium]
MSEHRFTAMGCDVVVGGGTSSEHRAIEDLFAEREQVFSRFRPDSELNRVNASSGSFAMVSPLFAETLRIALAAADETDGLVTPTLGASLEAVGYTRDSALLAPDPEPAGPPVPAGAVVAVGRAVRLGAGVKLDLNGVVKALAVDDALALLPGDGFVSAGGDLGAHGDLVVALPGGGSVSLLRGALATSGTTKRWWLRAGEVQHHLIDPQTGLPCSSPWSLVTACGASCLAADIAAKAGFLLGEHGPAWLDARRIPARFVAADGSVIPNDTWRESMRGPACT